MIKKLLTEISLMWDDFKIYLQKAFSELEEVENLVTEDGEKIYYGVQSYIVFVKNKSASIIEQEKRQLFTPVKMFFTKEKAALLQLEKETLKIFASKRAALEFIIKNKI
jgi:hypothetical protein